MNLIPCVVTTKTFYDTNPDISVLALIESKKILVQ